MVTAIVIVVLIVVIGMYFLATYNRLVRLRQNVRESWSAIDTELRRRYDLIPNLVATVKGYATHERETLEAVIQARNIAAGNHGTAGTQIQTENVLNGALRQLFALAEAYPQLQANQNFQQLQRDLSETEDRMSQARRFYNANVREFNNGVESFPSSLVAGGFSFQAEQYFEIEEVGAREPVQVKF